MSNRKKASVGTNAETSSGGRTDVPDRDSYDALVANIRGLAESFRAVNQRAVREYGPLVEGIIRSRSHDVQLIEHTLDGLLSFCGYDPALQLYRRLCRHYFEIDPKATTHYVNAYREMWDSDV